MYSNVLIANRGEIALRIISTLQDHGIEAILTVSDIDKTSLPARRADKILHLPGKTAQETYLNITDIVSKAHNMGVDAIHPGYGFLAENSEFARETINNKMDFIGPTPDQMFTLGDKIQARKIAEQAAAPLIPGTLDNLTMSEYEVEAKIIGFPLLVKASAGGGGRGIRYIVKEDNFKKELKIAKSEAKLAFNDDRVYLEKFIANGRHIEVQIIGDGEGNTLHFGERDCSIQRKNQKLIEESPAPISRKKANEIYDSAISLVNELDYKNAGTVEFLVDQENHYFLEVNARIQVEHPVTEFVTGEDLIWRQIQVSSGNLLELKQKDIKIKGHSIEARVYAENPYDDFSPSTGKIYKVRHPIGPGVRVDSAIEDGDVITPYYDPMISKVIVHAPNRDAAILKLRSALDHYTITGIHTTIPYIKKLLKETAFSNLQYHTRYLENYQTKIPVRILDLARIAATSTQMSGQMNLTYQSGQSASKWRDSAWKYR